MQHITGISRNRLQVCSLEDNISQDNPVRFIDAFVEHISLESIGFIVQTLKGEGRPSFDSINSQPDGLQLQEVGDFEALNCLPPKNLIRSPKL